MKIVHFEVTCPNCGAPCSPDGFERGYMDEYWVAKARCDRWRCRYWFFIKATETEEGFEVRF